MENIEQKVEAAGQSQVNAIANLNAQNVYLGTGESNPIAITNLITEPPAIASWQGRVAELEQIEVWLGAKKNIVGIKGIGGVGKSAIAAYVFVEKAGGFAEKLWLEVTGQPSFDLVLDTGLARLGKFTTERLVKLDSSQKLSEFLRILTDRRCLLVLDNLESVLDEERQLGSGYAEFLQLWSDRGRTSTIMLTTRDIPKILETLPCWLPPLQGLSDDEGAALLEAEGIIGEKGDRQMWSQFLLIENVWLGAA